MTTLWEYLAAPARIPFGMLLLMTAGLCVVDLIVLRLETEARKLEEKRSEARRQLIEALEAKVAALEQANCKLRLTAAARIPDQRVQKHLDGFEVKGQILIFDSFRGTRD